MKRNWEFYLDIFFIVAGVVLLIINFIIGATWAMILPGIILIGYALYDFNKLRSKS